MKNRRCNLETLTLYKLILLYILNKTEFPLTNSQLSEFILDKGYTTYFRIQQALSELLEANFISAEHIRNSSYYSITASGRETLEFFGDKISPGIIDDINAFLEENHYRLRNESEIVADFHQKKKDAYTVHCCAKEGKNVILEIQMEVTDTEQANAACDNWREKSAEIYEYLINILLSKS